jgi:hypothetical protein
MRKRNAALAIATAAAVLAAGIEPCRADGLRLRYAAKTRTADQPSVVNVWTILEGGAAFVLLEGTATVARARKAVDAIERQFLDAIAGRGACANRKTRGDSLRCAWELVPDRAGLSFVGAVAYGDVVEFSQQGALDVLVVRGGTVRKLHGHGEVAVQAGDTFLLASRSVVQLGDAAIVSMLDQPSGDLEFAAELLTVSPPASTTIDATAVVLRFLQRK